MKENVIRKNALLGMNYSTAYNRLRKIVLWKYIVLVGDDVCYRCGGRIESIDQLSIEHKNSWMNAKNPVEAFFDLDNVAFSHLSCNCASTSPELKSTGERNGNSKLTEKDVRKIRLMLNDNTQDYVAKYFGVDPTTIGNIAHKKTWAWLK